MSDEERAETAEEALREIVIACGLPDPSSGEGTTPAEVVCYVKKRLQLIERLGGVFRHYERLHREKRTASGDQKAEENRLLAVECEESIGDL